MKIERERERWIVSSTGTLFFLRVKGEKDDEARKEREGECRGIECHVALYRLSSLLYFSPLPSSQNEGQGGDDSLTGSPDLCLNGLGIDLDAPGGELDSNR